MVESGGKLVLGQPEMIEIESNPNILNPFC